MRLQYRVLLAQVPALLVIVVMLLFGGVAVQRLGEAGRSVLADNYRSVLAAERMKESLERLDSAALFRIVGEPARADALVAEHRPLFDAELQVEEANITEPGEREIAASLRQNWTEYRADYDRFVAAAPGDARTLYFEALLPTFQAVKADADRVLVLNQDAMVRRSDEAAEHARATRRSWFAWSALGLLGAVGLGVYVSRRITDPLRAISASAEQVGEGHLDVRLPRTHVAELDVLAGAFNRMAERLRLYRRASDSELARAREAAQAAIDSLADPVVVLTLKAEVRATNLAARRLLGLDRRTRRLDRIDPGLSGVVEAVHALVVAEGRPVIPADFARVVVTETADGERAFLPHATPINDAVTGELVGVTVLLQDVTRLRRLDELKGNLVQTVAHELRTPLTSLGMALHLALDERVCGPVGGKLLVLLESARDDVARLRALVEDLLDLSRIQEDRVVLRKEPVSPRALLESVRVAVEAEAAERRVVVRIEGPSDLTPLELDRPRAQLALVNLASNAIRHAPEGSAVLLRALDVDGTVRFEVDDAGPGVPVHERERIFEPFARGAAESGPGAGLGLHIAREVARAHGGRLGVGAAEVGGARFWMEVPR
ncbi:MAG: ATP-binding protein [Pseudomonadota bacterium]|nr:ATP-binding protein [Pseudomonadota bacterium]